MGPWVLQQPQNPPPGLQSSILNYAALRVSLLFLGRTWILFNGPVPLYTPDPKLDTLPGPGEASSKLITSALESSYLGKRRRTHPSCDNLRGEL